MKRFVMTALICFLTLGLTAGCGSSSTPPPREAPQLPGDDELPVLEQNQVPSFSTVSADYSEVQVFEDHDDDHQKVSEEERKLVFPPATD